MAESGEEEQSEQCGFQLPECAERWLQPCEDEGEVCRHAEHDKCSLCGQVTDYLKNFVRAPTDRCSFMRYLMDPISNTEIYQKYAHCKIEIFGYIIAAFSALLCLYSFFQAPYYCDVKSCFDTDNFECTTLWWFLSMYLFLKDLVLNIMGILTNVSLVIALKTRNLDCIYMWLVWRTTAIIINAVSIPLTGVFTLSISQNLNWEIFSEVVEFMTNVVTLIFVYAVYEKFAGCLEGGAGDEFAGEEDGFIATKRKSPRPRAIDDE